MARPVVMLLLALLEASVVNDVDGGGADAMLFVVAVGEMVVHGV